MAFGNIDGLGLGKFLQIVFSDGVYNQLSTDFRDWEQVKMMRVGDPNGRQMNFSAQSSYGPAAVQYRNPNFTSSFPDPQQAIASEFSAVYKELDCTVMIEYNLWNRARKSPAKYADPLAWEIQQKANASKRRLAADLYGDGTGVIGQVSSVVDTTGASGHAEVTLVTTDTAAGHIGFFEDGDLLLAKVAAGTDSIAPTVVGTFYAWRVKSKTRINDKVRLEAVNSAGTVLSLTASNLANTDFFYRVGQPTFPNRASIADYGTATEIIAGLESLAHSDGRVIHGMTLQGAYAASTFDASAAALDVSHLQQALSQTKVRVGQSAYSFKKMIMAPEAHDQFIESREDDRRFNSIEDNKRGIRIFAYQHGNDSIETYTTEYCPKKRLYVLPENKGGAGKVMEFHGSDFEPVSVNGSDPFMLQPSSSGGHNRRIVHYMEAMGTLVCKHPAAITRIHNFTL